MDENQKGKIIINTGTLIRFFLFALLIIALYYISDVVLVVLAAIVIASAIEPLVRRLKRKGVHRTVSVVGIYVILAVLLTMILVLFLPSLLSDFVKFLNGLPQTISLQNLWSPFQSIGGDVLSTSTSISSKTISVSQFIGGLQGLVVGTGAGAFKAASVLFGGVLSLILIIVLSFYLAVQEDGVGDFLRIIAPVKHHDYIVDLWKRSQRQMALWLQGQVILGIIMGIIVYAILAIVGIDHALLFAVLTAMFEIIPVFGPILSSIPAILLAFVDKGLGIGLLVTGIYLIIYQVESQLLYPLVVKKISNISPIVVILALVVGAKLAGVLGALVAVPLSGALMEYIRDIEKYKSAQKAERAVLKNQS